MKTFFILFMLVAAMSSYDGKDALLRAVEFERAVNTGKIAEAQFTQTMDELLNLPARSTDALFVRALLHASAAQWVGQANNGVLARYSAESLSGAPAWLRFYAGATHDEQVSYDCIRHLALENKLLHADSLRAEVALYIDRAERMGETALASFLADTHKEMVKAGTDAAACRPYWLAARLKMRPAALQLADMGDTLLLYTRHAYHYKPNVCGAQVTWGYKPGGDLLSVSVRDGNAKPLFKNDIGSGHFHGADLWFDANRIVFSYAIQNSWPPPAQYETVWPKPEKSNACFAHELRQLYEPPHLYELNLDTRSIVQLTDHNYWGDTEPAYLPSGGIVFASDRGAHSPSCDSKNNELTDLNLYTLTPGYKTVRRLLNHKDIDTHPRLLNDGSIAYLRWEYQERHFWEIHSVWTARPDGTNADAIYKQHIPQPFSVRLATPLGPHSQRLLAIATGHHCLPQGPLVILDPGTGGNNPDGLRVLTRGMKLEEGKVPGRAVPEGGRIEVDGFYTDPHGLSEKSVLASFAFASPSARRYAWNHADVDANGYGIYLVDVYGNKELLFRDPWFSAYNALPLSPRPAPPVIADITDRSKNYATCTIADVYQGMNSVSPGSVHYIRISEALPWTVVPSEGVKRWVDTNYTGDSKDATRWCPVRVIGTVPVESDGSAHFKVPVNDNASVYFQALDENYMEIRRMRSSVSFAPGEVRSCTGCHETQSAVAASSSRSARAMSRKPSEPIPPAWGANKPVHFPRDVQPIFDNHCVSCHSGNTPEGSLDFSAGKAFRTIKDKKLVTVSNHDMDGSVTRVKQFGSHVSKLTQAIRSQEKMKVTLTDAEWQTLVTWVDANIPYTGEMFHLRMADGRTNVWAPFEWTYPWGQPQEFPALGEYIPEGVRQTGYTVR